uniref:Translation initiation factor eIF2B subunit delta n=1 Tax=Tanacetum cinerariifolium TaxID=118510 RepID=A0A6L2LRR7_TANCI|nr:initiation factor 2B-related protein [Tanacetum cinerariifolium]
MDSRRRIIDPKVRKVGFFTPGPPPDRTQSGPAGPSSQSPISNSLSPVMIPPARQTSENLTLSRGVGVPVPNVSRGYDSLDVGSYAMSESVMSEETESPPGRVGIDGEFSEDSVNWMRNPRDNGKSPAVDNEDSEDVAKAQFQKNSKPLKEKTTKAERRALQEAQRAAKAEGKKAGATSGVSATTSKPVKQPKQKKDVTLLASSNAVPEKKGGDKSLEKDRKKDTVPNPRMQFDDKSRVEKAKKRSVVQQTEARNRVEMFRHLPQYERANQLSDLESKFFQLDHVHPAIYEVGLRFLAGDIMWSTTRCIAMLQAFKKVIEDYLTPSEKTLSRDLTAKINSSVSFLIECRPLSISMGNAIRFLKALIQKSTLAQTDSEAKASLCSDIDRYINEKIILADKVIIRHAVTKIRDGDVLLTYGCSSLIEAILLHAYELRRQFRVVIVDSRPNLEVTRVFLGAASVLSNGTIYSTVGTACIAMVAHAYHVPVLVCCESFKFHERVQLDAICSNELGDPDVIAKVPGRMNNCLDDWASKENLQLLNLAYDVTPADYVSMIVTEYGMIPPTSVPVIVREYCRDHILI